jgi:hypothetical protein
MAAWRGRGYPGKGSPVGLILPSDKMTRAMKAWLPRADVACVYEIIVTGRQHGTNGRVVGYPRNECHDMCSFMTMIHLRRRQPASRMMG